MAERAVVEKIKLFVNEMKRQQINVEKVILYGSRAAGNAHEYSDIDVAVVSPDFGKNRYREGAKLFEIASKIDPLIEPVPFSSESYRNDTWNPLIYEIREKGIVIKTA